MSNRKLTTSFGDADSVTAGGPITMKNQFRGVMFKCDLSQFSGNARALHHHFLRMLDVVVPSSISLSSVSGSLSQTSITFDADSDDKIFGDEGTLCWNLLISHLFFDAKKNAKMKTSWKARIQVCNLLSLSMKTGDNVSSETVTPQLRKEFHIGKTQEANLSPECRQIPFGGANLSEDAESIRRGVMLGLGDHCSFKKVGRVSSDYSKPKEALDKMLAEDDEIRSPTTKNVILDAKRNTSSSVY
ncbi:hypothetical protein FXO38_21951 [Capsicum annuum]|nr:hypothetical protein FXO37_30723 [Capsicum annuum]KAF3640788.1 hypothetical protein FXO38_21951 [Capsicum annuum]